MSNVRIVTDSIAELSPEVLEALEITVVPWQVQLDGDTVVDTPDLRTPDFYQRNSSPPIAIPPTAAEFAETFGRCARASGEIVVVLSSSRITRSLELARQARGEFVGRCQIHLIDSGFISCPLGALVVEAARAARADAGAAEIVRYINGLIARTYFAFYAESPDQMLHHGLVQNSPEVLGTPSGYKPLLLMEEGKIAPLPRSRKRGEPIERIVEFVGEFGPLENLWTVSTGLHPGLELLHTLLSEEHPDHTYEDHIYGPVVASYLGSSLLGVAAIEALL